MTISNQALLRGGEPKQLGEVLAAYLLTSEDNLAKAFRAAYNRFTPSATPQTNLPPANDYVALIHFIRAQECAGINWFVRARGNRSEMARLLTPVVGWVVDVNAMRRAEQRMKKRPI